MPPSESEPKNIKLESILRLPGELDGCSVGHRAVFWRLIGQRGLEVKRSEILEGIGADGSPLQPVKRKHGGPPLIPHTQSSRTYRLLAMASRAVGATLFWRGGGGRETWSTILGYHAYKHGPRSLPVRNTIGISPAGTRLIQNEVNDWEDGYKAGYRDAGTKEEVEYKAGYEDGYRSVFADVMKGKKLG